MKHNWRWVLVLMLLLVAVATPVWAADEEIGVYVDGRALAMESAPVIAEGRILVPVRSIFEALGAELQWTPATQSVLASKNGRQVRMQIGQSSVYIDSEVRLLDVPAQLIGDRTYVPLRFVAEAFDAAVAWDELTRSVRIATTKVEGEQMEVKPFGFSVFRPQGWLAQENWPGQAVRFTNLKQGEKGKVWEFFYVSVLRVDPEVDTLDKMKDHFISSAQSTYKDFKLLSDTRITIAGSPAQKIVYSSNENGVSITRMRVFTFTNDYVYLLGFTAETGNYGEFLPLVDHLLGSFTITGPVVEQQPEASPQS